MTLEEMITQIVLGIITILGAIVTYYVVPVLKTKVKYQKVALLNSFVEDAVRSANQLYTPEQWKDKKYYVENLIAEYLNYNTGLNFTKAQINAIIEGVVRSVKVEEGTLNGYKDSVNNNSDNG